MNKIYITGRHVRSLTVGIFLLLLSACAQGEPQSQISEADIQTAIAGTQLASISSTPESTNAPTIMPPELTSQANQTKVAEYRITQDAKPTFTPRPTRPPTQIPTNTPEKSLEDIRSDIEQLLIDALEGGDDIKRVNFLQFDDLGTLNIELMTIWASS